MSVLVRFYANHVFLENIESILSSTLKKKIHLLQRLVYKKLTFFLNNKKYLIKTSFRSSFLKDRFTQSGLSFLWKPRTFGDNVLLHYLSLLMLALSPLVHHIFSQKYFQYFQSVPLPSNSMNSQLRYKSLSPYIFSEYKYLAIELLRTLSRMAASKPTSSL